MSETAVFYFTVKVPGNILEHASAQVEGPDGLTILDHPTAVNLLRELLKAAEKPE